MTCSTEDDKTTIALLARHDIDAVITFDDDSDALVTRIDPSDVE